MIHSKSLYPHFTHRLVGALKYADMLKKVIVPYIIHDNYKWMPDNVLKILFLYIYFSQKIELAWYSCSQKDQRERKIWCVLFHLP